MANIAKRAPRNHNHHSSKASFGNPSSECLTRDQRSRALRRLAAELVSGSGSVATITPPIFVDTDAALIRAINNIARRARISPAHAGVIVELAGVCGGSRQ